MKEAVKKCLEMGGWRLMPHFSLEGVGSGSLPGLPCPQCARAMRAGIVAVTGNPSLQCRAAPAGQDWCSGYGCPCHSPLVNRLFLTNQVCVFELGGPVCLLHWEEGLWNMKGFSWRSQSALGRVRERVFVLRTGEEIQHQPCVWELLCC